MDNVAKLARNLIEAKKRERPLSQRRMDKYTSNIKTIQKIAGNEPLEVVLKDLKATRRLVERIDSSDYQAWTRADFRLIVKMLWKLANNYDLEDRPKEVRFIKTGIRRNERKKSWSLITDAEIGAMLTVANSRDKAILSVLYELGPRVGELVKMRKLDVTFHEQGCRLTIPAGKTDERTLLVVNSVPYLAAWLAAHPVKRDDAPLFVAEYHKQFQQMRTESVLKMIKTVAERAGIQRRVYCHLFRHTAMTTLAKTLSEHQLKVAAGWEADSSQAATYVHLSGADLDSALLRARGQPVKAEDVQNKLAPLLCSRCGTQNPHDARGCWKCLFIFDKEAVRRQEAQKEAELHDLRERLERLESEREGRIRARIRSNKSGSERA